MAVSDLVIERVKASGGVSDNWSLFADMSDWDPFFRILHFTQSNQTAPHDYENYLRSSKVRDDKYLIEHWMISKRKWELGVDSGYDVRWVGAWRHWIDDFYQEAFDRLYDDKFDFTSSSVDLITLYNRVRVLSAELRDGVADNGFAPSRTRDLPELALAA